MSTYMVPIAGVVGGSPPQLDSDHGSAVRLTFASEEEKGRFSPLANRYSTLYMVSRD